MLIIAEFCYWFGWNFQETSKLRAGGHGFINNNPAALSQSCGSRPPHHGSRGKIDRKISSSPADHTRVPYSHQNHHYHYQRHTGHPRALQHNQSLHPLEEKDSRSYHHKQSTVRITWLNSMKKISDLPKHPTKKSPGMAQVTWQRAQGVDTSTKFPRSKSDRASVSNAGISPLPWRTRLTTLFTQSRQHPGVRHHSTPPEVLFPCISESEQSLIHSGVFMDQTWNLLQMLERIGISGISMPWAFSHVPWTIPGQLL